MKELLNILNNNLDYALELGVLQEPQLCVKPVYKFERAFIDGEDFCMIYSEADDPEFITASYNSDKFEKITGRYDLCKTIYYDKNGGCESFYYNGKNYENIEYLNFRLLALEDKNIEESCGEDDYINIIFKNFIEEKIWNDCGIIGAFDEYNNFTGYLAYYELAENIRDVSYIYIKSESRRLNYAKKLLNYFKNKNVLDGKMSYYSYAADEASANLAKSCGFLSCARRFEREIN